jgi:hypothetical protein
MSLGDKQRLFTRLLGVFLNWVHSHPGWELTLGEGYDDDFTGHMPGSLHYVKLAQDLNLFVDKYYVSTEHPVWDQLGAYWKSLHPLCRWGGDFASKDYNHISIAHDGKA